MDFEERKKQVNDALNSSDEWMEINILTSARDENGKDFYLYLAAKPSKYPEYLMAQANGLQIEFEDFGRILKTGPGFPPPKEVMEEMEAKHDMNHNFEAEIKEALSEIKGGFTAKHFRKEKPVFTPRKKPEGN